MTSEQPITIQTVNLKKTYVMGDTEVHALDDVSFKIRQGEMTAIIGQSGSGKSTLMNILGCLDRPTSGMYYLDNQNVAQMSDNQLATIRNKNIGFVFQSFNLLPRMSALENVELPLLYAGLAHAKDKAREALVRVGLGERYNHEPNQMSGGQRQRVAVARALVTNPTMVLADEPTGNLDSKTTNEIMDLFHELNAQGVTLLIVTHEPEIANYCKRSLKMRDGKIIEDTAPVE
ncbi:ABC transporter ATP-binding protein [Candidatus Sumerlaeota bacterium]|nr:ABC transporter ATP-binding protein [Candidatus Sumerlaeales bacterium]NLD61841.1 ABC transporter ATP-binding protein [Candidatus Sumerlaeota bacterium]